MQPQYSYLPYYGSPTMRGPGQWKAVGDALARSGRGVVRAVGGLGVVSRDEIIAVQERAMARLSELTAYGEAAKRGLTIEDQRRIDARIASFAVIAQQLMAQGASQLPSFYAGRPGAGERAVQLFEQTIAEAEPVFASIDQITATARRRIPSGDARGDAETLDLSTVDRPTPDWVWGLVAVGATAAVAGGAYYFFGRGGARRRSRRRRRFSRRRR